MIKKIKATLPECCICLGSIILVATTAYINIIIALYLMSLLFIAVGFLLAKIRG